MVEVIGSMDNAEVPLGLTEAVQYLRMSTSHQRLSLQYQAAKIAEYASSRGFHITETYADRGSSGLTIRDRSELRRLLDDVLNKTSSFRAILVYDVSRWGRFQDVDESAHYEFIYRSAGISVHYCAEMFENDGSMFSSVMKLMKRAMAREFSRDLSAKTFHAHCQGIKRGHHQGGSAGFGLKRVMVDLDGKPLGVLGSGERKALRDTMVLLAPGPAQEVSIVRRAFKLFVDKRLSISQIADDLNGDARHHSTGIRWTAARVRKLLQNERYIGNQVYNRTSRKLKGKRVANHIDEWVRSERTFPALIDSLVFEAAQKQLSSRWQTYSDDELLSRLRDLGTRTGYLTTGLINSCQGMPVSATYISRFGSMKRAYELVGIDTSAAWKASESARVTGPQQAPARQLLRSLSRSHAVVTQPGEDTVFTVDGAITAQIIVAPFRPSPKGRPQWRVPLFFRHSIDAVVIVRLDKTGRVIQEFFVLPGSEFSLGRVLTLYDKNAPTINRFAAQGEIGVSTALAALRVKKRPVDDTCTSGR
jgi:DNA invertase Pin-like site-specific DNA recombinase